MEKHMMLVKGDFDGKASFRLIPLTKDAPYNEMIFEPVGKMLILLSKESKESYHKMPLEDDLGKVRKNVKGDVLVKNVKLNTYQEYYITEESDIKDIITTFAFNAGTFDYQSFLKAPSLKDAKKSNLILPT